jgi:hypothetical protein
LRHPWTGKTDCPAASQYKQELAKRQRTEAETLAHLTGWDFSQISRKAGLEEGGANGNEKKWYQKIWKD